MNHRVIIGVAVWLPIIAFGTSMGTKVSIKVSNAGFEGGLSGWSGGDSMALDETVAHAGRRSACLTVCDPKQDNVYITRQIPIRGGALYEASCFVKTVDVREASGGRPSVGAGLIVEWAGKDGKWLNAGEYACGCWGTTDWKLMTCKRLIAPENAGYAIVFLALRASGKAWFDDVSMAEVLVPTEKIEPANMAIVSNNCPHFAWRLLPNIRRYTLELSSDPTFSEGNVRTFAAGGFAEFQLEKPLVPGVWYWRVNSMGRLDSEVWSFTQTAHKDVDCIPPLVLTKAHRVTNSEETFIVRVKDEGERLPDVRFNGVKGRYAGSDGGNVLHYAFDPWANGWPKGLTEGEMLAVDGAGNCATSSFWLLNAKCPENGVMVDSEGFYRQGGKRIFPLGIYEVAPKYMDEVRLAGWDAVHSYQWEFSQDNAACKKYLDACWAAKGLRAFIGFDRGTNSRKGIAQGNLAHVARRVGALADHPGLFCWYIFDEPEVPGQFVTPDMLTQLADLVRALDPYHAVVMTTWSRTMGEYRRTWDTHWTQAYGDPAAVMRQIDEHRRFLADPSPITLLVNCNDNVQGAARRKGVQPDHEKFARDYDHLRACAFLGIVKKCNGLWWWMFARDTPEYYTAAQSPKAWADLVKVVKELRAIRHLVTTEGPVVTGTAKVGEDSVEWWRKTVDGKQLFIAVNTADHPVSVQVELPDDTPRRLDLRRYEARTEGFEPRTEQ